MTTDTLIKPQAVSIEEPQPAQPLTPLPAGWRSLARALVRQARRQPERTAMVDSAGTALSYRNMLVRSLALGRVLARRVGLEPYLGLFLPPTVPGAIANVAASLWGKIPVNLNYTAGKGSIDSAIAQCGIRHVVTSRKVLDKVGFELAAEPIFLEDIPKQVTKLDKLWAWSIARLVPEAALGAFVPGLRDNALDKIATVIFTSGSTGEPKGVVLSHRNILSNVHEIDQQLHLLDKEVVLGVLPFFHSMGYTVTIWTVLLLGKAAVYHFDPLAAQVVGDLCEKHGVTLIVASPTFMRTYLARCEPKQFASLFRIVLGAEKLKPELALRIRERLNVEPLEGYGCTELSPVVAVNVNHELKTGDGRSVAGNRPGTVGMPLPGTAIKTVDPDSGENLPRGKVGVVYVKGPQVMVGYHNHPEATAAVLKDGWYCTGDLGRLDDDGFLTITDRLSRFSKIGGEMVPHQGVEAALIKALGVDEQTVAVTALPDPKRGERLVVLHTQLPVSIAELQQRLVAGTVPKLWIPSPTDFIQVEALPLLGSGKLDLRGLRRVAEERLAVVD